MQLPYRVTILYEDKETRTTQCESFDSFDEMSEKIKRLNTLYGEHYLFQGCLNESIAHPASCIPDEFCQEYGYAVVSAKHWTVFFNPQTGLLRFSDDPEDEWSDTMKLADYFIEVKEDNKKYTVYIFIK